MVTLVNTGDRLIVVPVTVVDAVVDIVIILPTMLRIVVCNETPEAPAPAIIIVFPTEKPPVEATVRVLELAVIDPVVEIALTAAQAACEMESPGT